MPSLTLHCITASIVWRLYRHTSGGCARLCLSDYASGPDALRALESFRRADPDYAGLFFAAEVTIYV